MNADVTKQKKNHIVKLTYIRKTKVKIMYSEGASTTSLIVCFVVFA